MKNTGFMAVWGAIVLLGLTGCGAGEAPGKTTAPPSSSEPSSIKPPATPTPSPTVEALVVDISFGVTDAQVQPYLSESIEGFKIRPIEERVLVPLWRADQEGLGSFAQEWGRLTQNPLDVLPAQATADNSPQEVVAWDAWMKRLSVTTTGPDGMTLVEDTARKTLMGSSANEELSAGYQAVSQYINTKLQSEVQADRLFIMQAIAASGSLPMPAALTATPVAADEYGRPSTDITMRDPATGTELIRTYNLVTSTAGPAMWVQE